MLQKALKTKATPLVAGAEVGKILNSKQDSIVEQDGESLQAPQDKGKKLKKNKAENGEIISEDSKKTKGKAVKNPQNKNVEKLESSPTQAESKQIANQTKQTEQIQAQLVDSKNAELKSFEEALRLDEIPSIEELQKQTPKSQSNATQKPNALASSIAALESEALQNKSKSGDKKNNEKNPKKDTQSKGAKNTDSESLVQTSKAQNTQLEESQSPLEQSQIQEEEKSFAEMLLAGGKKKTKIKETEAMEEGKGKAQSKQSAEVLHTKENTRTQILYRSALARESVRNFAQTLREEVLNYKPPITKLSLELNPQNLGTLELTITKKGKDLHIQVVSNATAVGLFLQNQVDFRNNLAQVGFENVDLSFSSNENGGGNKGQNGGNSTPQEQQQEGNKNSLEDSQNEINVMHITLPKYA
ncbi:flagellar hook-length control protein FliK [Helicobacter cinaedi]|uniref:flagellar hook-length control protein FliK n=1 Tax=Helicobacter cinaedi TaxID=213 RepID=UPI000D7D212C|nr:flagellar hook-length control protein FliK [Helicobacter cinaedi]